MKNYIVTHTFKSKEAKAKMIEVTGSMSMEDMTKAVSYTHLTLPTNREV